MVEITVRIYSETDMEVLKKAVGKLDLPEPWVSFDTCHEGYNYNEAFIKMPDSDFEKLKFSLHLEKPDVYEF